MGQTNAESISMSDFFPSPNNPGIFSSSEWISAWNETWGNDENIEDVGSNRSSANQRYYFYRYKKILPFWLKLNTLFSAGISTAVSPSLRSEYFFADGDAKSYLQAASDFTWDQLYIPDLLMSDAYYRELIGAANAIGLGVRIYDTATTYAVDLRSYSFETYLAGLGSSTRLKLFNKRKKLYQLGEVKISNIWPRLDEFIAILNRFHIQRWGKACYQGRNLQQIKLFLSSIAESGAKPNLSIIYFNEEPVSAVLDLSYRQRIYNIQSGYLEKFEGGISLGTLHFGFQLEQAFQTGETHYDFMAGSGKNANYKAALSTDSDSFVSLLLVRNPLLKLLYKIKDTLKL